MASPSVLARPGRRAAPAGCHRHAPHAPSCSARKPDAKNRGAWAPATNPGRSGRHQRQSASTNDDTPASTVPAPFMEAGGPRDLTGILAEPARRDSRELGVPAPETDGRVRTGSEGIFGGRPIPDGSGRFDAPRAPHENRAPERGGPGPRRRIRGGRAARRRPRTTTDGTTPRSAAGTRQRPASGKEVRSPPPPPLRTVRAPCNAYGSSLLERPSRDAARPVRFRLAVDLPMAMRVQQLQVVVPLITPSTAPDPMVDVPGLLFRLK